MKLEVNTYQWRGKGQNTRIESTFLLLRHLISCEEEKTENEGKNQTPFRNSVKGGRSGFDSMFIGTGGRAKDELMAMMLTSEGSRGKRVGTGVNSSERSMLKCEKRPKHRGKGLLYPGKERL